MSTCKGCMTKHKHTQITEPCQRNSNSPQKTERNTNIKHYKSLHNKAARNNLDDIKHIQIYKVQHLVQFDHHIAVPGSFTADFVCSRNHTCKQMLSYALLQHMKHLL